MMYNNHYPLIPDDDCGWCWWVVFVGGVCGWCLWVVFVGGVCGWCLWVVFVGGVCGWCLWVVLVDGVCGTGYISLSKHIKESLLT